MDDTNPDATVASGIRICATTVVVVVVDKGVSIIVMACALIAGALITGAFAAASADVVMDACACEIAVAKGDGRKRNSSACRGRLDAGSAIARSRPCFGFG